jgi:hypothetical protein
MVLRAMRRYDDGYQSEKQQANIMKEEKEKGDVGEQEKGLAQSTSHPL